MTLNQLKNDVARLGFEKDLEDMDCLVASANRALSLIYIDRPVSKTAILSFTGPRAIFVREFIEHKEGTDVTLQVYGRSIYFRSVGKGSCIIRDNRGATTVPLESDGQITKRMLYGDATVTFTGEYYFTVSNLAVFDSLISSNTVDIPEYAPYRELIPSDYCDGFRAFSGYPKDSRGNTVKTVSLNDGRIIAPFDLRGELYLTYYRTPEPISGDNPNRSIDVSEECAPLLPLLTASFMWLDDDTQKAQYYMSLYRDLIANVRRYSTNKIDAKYSTNGWA